MSAMQVQCRPETSKFRGKQRASRIRRNSTTDWDKLVLHEKLWLYRAPLQGRPQVGRPSLASASAEETA